MGTERLSLLGAQLYCCSSAFRSLGLWARMSFLYLDSCWLHFPFVSLLVSEGSRAHAAGFLDWAYGAGLLLPMLGEFMLFVVPSHQALEGFGNSVRKL